MKRVKDINKIIHSIKKCKTDLKTDHSDKRLFNLGDASALNKPEKKISVEKISSKVTERSDKDLFFDNLITLEELAVIFGLAPKTIRNWVALKKIPSVRIGRKHYFQQRSLQEWLNRKEKPQWQ